MIPKIIHYCWFGGNKIPNSVKLCIKTWKKYCPDYEIRVWNESCFDVNSHPFVKKAYACKAWAFVSDYVRLQVVYENGGIYLDTDVELIKSLDDLLQNKCYFGLQQDKNLCNTGIGFGAEKGSPIVKKMMDEYENVEFNPNDMLSVACPTLNTNALLKNGYEPTSGIFSNDEFTVYPTCYFDPYSTQDKTNLLCENTYSIHHYNASWCSGLQRMKRKIVFAFGEESIIKVRRKLSL